MTRHEVCKTCRRFVCNCDRNSLAFTFIAAVGFLACFVYVWLATN